MENEGQGTYFVSDQVINSTAREGPFKMPGQKDFKSIVDRDLFVPPILPFTK